jgi:putative restriction endonuclease
MSSDPLVVAIFFSLVMFTVLQEDALAVWWVFQNKSFPRSRAGGYLWAPMADKLGHKKSHWEAMSHVEPGDVILSSMGRKIVATSIAKSRAYPSPQPDPQDAEFWVSDGRRVDVAYADLPEPIYVGDLHDLFSLLSAEAGPLNESGRGKQGYLYAVQPMAAKQILERIGESIDIDQLLADADAAKEPGPITTANRTQKVRVGQQKFREEVISLWRGRCAVSAVSDQRLLIASHIKSWRLSNDRERIDPHNGLLLEARIDRLFDEGLITFDSDGGILFSPDLGIEDRRALGLDENIRIKDIPKKTAQYLQFHRSHIFLTG